MSTGSCVKLMALLMTMINQGHSVCTPAEEGQQLELKCHVGNRKMDWSINSIQVLYCDVAGVCWGRSKVYTGSITQIGNEYEGQLIIKEVIRNHNGKWSCSFSDSASTQPFVTVCDPLEVYTKPVNVTCDQPVLVNSNTNVFVTCRTDKIYPKAGCQFYKGENKVTGLVDITNTSFNQSGNGYYRSQCTLTVPIKDLGQGSHSFIVKMYPDVTGGPSYGVDSKETQAMQLSLPKAALDPGCLNGPNVKDGYIKKGETVSCNCKTKSTGNPPGTVKWKDGSGTDVLTIDNTNTGQSYTCVGSSVLGLETLGVNYSPELAFGPTSVRVLHDSGLDHYDLCPPDTSIDVTVYCEVPVTNVNPEPIFTVSINSLSPSRETNVTNTTHYRRRSVFTFTTSGRHEVICLAENSKFPTIPKKDTLLVEIRGPPTSEPRIRLASGNLVLNGETANVVEGDDITCYVEGGYPPSDVTLTCQSGNNSMTVVQGTMEVSMDISNHNDKINCTCTADQRVSMCLNNKISWFTFHESKESKASSSGAEAAIIGSVVGGFLIIVLGVVIFCVLKRKGKLSSCPKSSTGHQQKQLSDSPTQVDDPNSHTYLNQHQNEVFDFDGYEVPVTPHLTSDYENSLAAGNTEDATSAVSTTPGRIGKGDTVYENSL